MNNYPNLTLNTGAQMPILGLGTYKIVPEQATESVRYAIEECGYSHIDCAAIYMNEKEIGRAFEKIFHTGSKKREEIFITSKLWNSEHKRNDVKAAYEKTLADLRIEYLDLYLMHWGIAIPPSQVGPRGRMTEQFDNQGYLVTDNVSVRETWEAMEELVNLGLVKAIGVANFTVPMLVDLLTYAKIKPAVNQVELHPYLQQKELLEFCDHNGIIVTAYAPLGSPGNFREKNFPNISKDEKILAMAEKYGKTPSQIIIRWGIQRRTVLIPKSANSNHIRENFAVFDFQLSNDDMNEINKLDRNLRIFNSYHWWKIPYFN
jgi:diketogulonate reductase-like aldo/keto reductase